MTVGATSSTSVTLTSSEPGLIEQATAVRYAWAEEPCCTPAPGARGGCAPGSCPLWASDSASTKLAPALPFMATLVEGRCKCQAPQQCGGPSVEAPARGCIAQPSVPTQLLVDYRRMPAG